MTIRNDSVLALFPWADQSWGAPAERVLEGLAVGHPSSHYHLTRFIQIGSMAGPTITLPAGVLRGNGILISGVGTGACHRK